MLGLSRLLLLPRLEAMQKYFAVSRRVSRNVRGSVSRGKCLAKLPREAGSRAMQSVRMLGRQAEEVMRLEKRMTIRVCWRGRRGDGLLMKRMRSELLSRFDWKS